MKKKAKKTAVRRIPKQARAKEKYDRILAACGKLLAERSYKDTSTNEIAVEAEVYVATVYDYFSDKESIFIAYMDDKIDTLVQSLKKSAIANIADSPLNITYAIIHAYFSFFIENKALVNIAFQEIPEVLRLASIERGREETREITKLLKWLTPNSITDSEFDTIVDTLTNVVVGYSIQLMLFPPDDLSPEYAADEMTRVIVGYANTFGIRIPESKAEVALTLMANNI